MMFAPMYTKSIDANITIKHDNNFKKRNIIQGKTSFAEKLNSKLDEIKFSRHAEKRLKSRALVMNRIEHEKLKNAVSIAARKGSREALCLIGNKAFVVSIPNRTVITAMNKDEIVEKIITNIDSAVMY